MSDDKTADNPLQIAKDRVNALYDFRDRYFETHKIEDAINKPEDVEKEMRATLEVLESLQDQISNKAEYLTLFGRTLNVQSGHDSAAQDALSKAVKLEPRLSEAWIALGECYWKNNDVESARNCFSGALSHCEDKVALRCLSMVLRQCGRTSEERVKLVEESVEKAKQAVQLDVHDGRSWAILANAYLSSFFSGNQSSLCLKQCLGAYQQAEQDSIAVSSPDLHFNHATVFTYQELYDQALEGFAQAARLDPSWSEPGQRETKLLSYLDTVQRYVQTKGCLRAKKVHSLVDSIKDSQLGPYGGGSYTSNSGATVSLTKTSLSALEPGANPEKVVLGRVVCSVHTDDPVPFTFCMVDEESSCFAVTVYNIAPGWGVKIGDSVAIPEPCLQQVHVQYKNKEFKFSSLRVNSPVVMVVNGRKLSRETQAPTVLTVSALSE